jgi:hypothetical protein
MTRMPRLESILAGLPFLAVLSFGGVVRAAPTLAVGVRASGPVEKAKDVQDIEEGIPKQFASGLEAAGYAVELVNDAPTAARIRDCTSDDCLQNTTSAGVASLAAQVNVEARRSSKKGRDFTVFVVLARTTPDRQVWREKHACRSCSVDAAKHLAFLIGAQLAAEVSKVPAPPPAPSPVEAPALAAQTPVEQRVTVPAADVQTSAPGGGSFTVPRYVPWVALGAGAVTFASGLYLLSIDDDPSCDLTGAQRRCPERYATKTPGRILAVGGGLLAVAGVVSLFFREEEGRHGTSLSISPTGLFIHGSF